MFMPPDLDTFVGMAGIDWLIARTSLDGRFGQIAQTGLRDDVDSLSLRSRACSVTKPIVAAAVLLACRSHDEALDTPIIEHFPELRDVWRMDQRVTLAHLLSHTSGIAPSLDDDAQVALGDTDDALARGAEVIVAAAPDREPGASFKYQNEGYWLAGAILGRLTGGTFEDAVRTLVLEPAGMTRTGFDRPGDDELPPTGTGDPFPRVRRPSGGLWMPVDDMLRFATFVAADSRLLQQMGTARTDAEPGIGYGLGMFTVDGLGVLMHPGDWHDFHASLAIVPQHALATAVIAHGDGTRDAVRRVALAEFERWTGVKIG